MSNSQNVVRLKTNQEELALLRQDTVDFFHKSKHGNVHKWLFSVPDYDGDPVNGSAHWNSLYESENYYLPQYEIAAIDEFSNFIKSSPFMLKLMKSIETVYDLGPGSEDCVYKKSAPILKHLTPGTTYCPVDISSEFVDTACEAVKKSFDGFVIKPCLEDFERPTAYKSKNGLVLYFGSTMFNMPCSLTEGLPIRAFLEQIKAIKQFISDGYIMIAQDMTLDPEALHDAYYCDGHRNMTKNFLWRVQRDLKPEGNFDPSVWRYRPVWRPENHQFAHGVVPIEDQIFSIDGKKFHIKKGELFITHNSFKLAKEVFIEMAEYADLKLVKTIENERFAVHLFKVGGFLQAA